MYGSGYVPKFHGSATLVVRYMHGARKSLCGSRNQDEPPWFQDEPTRLLSELLWSMGPYENLFYPGSLNFTVRGFQSTVMYIALEPRRLKYHKINREST
jgi:hypothetical protein